MAQVDFYVLPEASDTARLKLACRLTERAYLGGARVLACLQDEEQLRTFDDMLWTFGDRAFVPHETLRPQGPQPEAPVLLSSGLLAPAAVSIPFDLAVNLGAATLPVAHFARIVEVLDADPARRSAARARYRLYREAGVEPRTHNLENDAALPAE